MNDWKTLSTKKMKVGHYFFLSSRRSRNQKKKEKKDIIPSLFIQILAFAMPLQRRRKPFVRNYPGLIGLVYKSVAFRDRQAGEFNFPPANKFTPNPHYGKTH